MTAPKTTSGEGWWWAWRAWLVLALAWLGACLWLSRETAPWTKGWVGWWTADALGLRAVGAKQVYLEPGAEVALVEGNAAFRSTPIGFVGLGHWRERRIPFTWAGWVRVRSPDGGWPTNFIRVRWAESVGNRLELGFADGRPRVELEGFTAGGALPRKRVSLDLQAEAPARLGEWMHLALSTDGALLRILINGRPVAEGTCGDQHGEALYLAALRLGGRLDAVGKVKGPPDGLSVEHDDVVLYERVVPTEELAALALRGRGAWARELGREEWARRCWRWGWPAVLGAMMLLLALHARPRWRRWLGELILEFGHPSNRPARWALLCGGVLSVALTMALERHARHADAGRFDELVEQLEDNSGVYWEKLAGLLARARDWVAAQPELSQDRLETWLKSNHFPHDYPGVIGVGWAEQVLPAERAAHEARWSARHGFAYRVWPGPEVARDATPELAGNPLLPVVLYAPAELAKERWFTNGTILGRDLLHRTPGGRRPWSESRRLETLVARNEISSSALETIAPAAWYGETISGLRLYAPWTLRQKPDGENLPLEPEGWRGVCFASVDLAPPLRAVFTEASPLSCRISVGGVGGELHDLVADMGQLVPATADRPGAKYRRWVEIPLYHRRLHMEVWTTRAFQALSFRRWAWVAGACSGGLTLLSVTLLMVQARARTRQDRMLADLRQLNSDLFLFHREREQMSRDLHDGSIQNLYALGLHLQRVRQLLHAAPDQARDGLGEGLDLLNQSIRELRRFLLSAGVEDAAQNTVPGALETLAGRLRRATSAEVELTVAPEAASLGARHGVQVVNVVREAVSNALRHADARRIRIRLEPGGSPVEGARRWVVEVSDDGCGFDVRGGTGGGQGLGNLAARAQELGGTSTVDSSPGGGTRVRVEFVERIAANGAGPSHAQGASS